MEVVPEACVNTKLGPNVVDEEMLRKAVEEQGPQEQAGRIAKEEVTQFNTVLQLRLDYRNIRKIDHVWQFTSLTKLQLTSNIIEKIEGLDCLTNLTWLDLSFNSIKKIGGLESLVKLQDLVLSNNRISVLENMEALARLQSFCIVNNLLGQLDENVIYLRKFKNLRILNIAGNPICQEETCTSFIAAHLPDLAYLNYRILHIQTKMEAFDKHKNDVEKIKEKEQHEQKTAEANQSQEDERQLHMDAFVEFLNGSDLFDSMFSGERDAKSLAYLPGAGDLLQTYKNHLVALCVQLLDIGLVQHKRRETEVESFSDCLKEAVADSQQRSSEQVQSNFKKMIAESHQSTDTLLLPSQFSEEIDQLCITLMTLELHLFDQLEDVFKDFKRNISEMVGSFIETVQGIFTQCRDLVNQTHEKMVEIATATLEKGNKTELEEHDDLRRLLLDKDTVMNALNDSHNNQLLKVDDRENMLVKRINGWVSDVLKGIQDEEMKRNLKRVLEIHNYIGHLRDQLEASQ